MGSVILVTAITVSILIMMEGQGGKGLVLLWQPECPLCEEELRELSGKQSLLKEAGIRLLALTSEGDAARRQLIRDKVIESGLPFEVGLLPDHVVEEMIVLHRHLFYQPYHFVVPAGFLLNEKNRLLGLFRGRVNWEELVAEVKSGPGEEEGIRVTPAMDLRPTVLIKDYLSTGLVAAAEIEFG